MATYISGVTDYIPQIQPFQPNINLMANVLQTKQNQYDSNHKQINDVYRQLIHADLSREDNQERRDELVKAIDFNLKKISGMDLSLQQNVRQAKQLFTPFYEDKYLMKDIALTKNYRSKASRAMSLKNSTDEKQRAMYWDTGMKAMEYKLKEFQNVDLESSLSFGDISYTNYVNTTEKALDLAKKSGLSIESIDFSPDGRWIIKNTNGEALREPLSKLFQATLAKDPAIQAVYQTQAYVNRKDYASTNASMFGGDENKAEIRYLQEQLENQGLKMKQRYDSYREKSNVYQNNIAAIEKSIAQGKAKHGAEKMLRELKSNKQINDVALQRLEEVKEQIEGSESSTLNTNNGFRNPYGDLETLRRKVDGAVANDLLFGDLNQAAETFAYRNFKQDVQANPYKVMEIKHQNALALERERATNRARLAEAKENARRQFERDKMLVDNGLATWDENGNIVINETHFKSQPVSNASGTATDALSISDQRKVGEDRLYEGIQNTVFGIGDMLYSELQKKNISAEDFENAMGMSSADYGKLKGDKENALKTFTPEKVNKILDNFSTFYSGESNGVGKHVMEIPEGFDKTFSNAKASLGAYEILYKEHTEWEKDIQKEIQNLIKQEKWKGDFAFWDDKKDRVMELYLDAVNESAPKDTRFMLGMPFKAAFSNTLEKTGLFSFESKQNETVALFEKKLIEEGLFFPQLNKLEQQAGDIAKSKGGHFSIGTTTSFAGSSKTYAGREFLDEAVQNYINPLTKTNYKNFDEYQKSVNKLGLKNRIGGVSRYDSDIQVLFNSIYDNYQSKVETINKKVHPLLSAYGDFSTNSAFITHGSSITVNPESKMHHPGLNVWHTTYRELQALDLKDSSKINLSVGGITTTGVNAMKDLDKGTMAGTDLVNSFIRDYYNNSNKAGEFQIEFFDIANNQLGKEAMVIKPNAQYVEKWRKTIEAEKYGDLSEDQVERITNDIIKNGISIIADDGTFNNSLAQGSRRSIVELAVDAKKGEPFIINDLKDPNNQIAFKSSDIHKGSYDATLTLNIVEDFNNPDILTSRTEYIPLSSSLESSYEAALDMFNLVEQLNMAAKNRDLNRYNLLLNAIIGQ